MKAILFVIAASLLLPLAAQNPGIRPPLPRQQQGHRDVAAPADDALQGNITIHLKGMTTTGNEIDLSLTGIGPTFMADQIVGNDNSMLSCEYSVKATETGYRVSYSIGMQQRVPTSVQKEVTNYEYRSVVMRGSVLCPEGKPVVIVKNGAKPLQIAVSTTAAEPGATPAPGEAR